ncbi:hypothetical protein [Ralstonia sp.]|uniref:hypothetical protein n=1 Tax=Ralstonia sp. TaxID=54061 RepID=UPI0031D940DB
MNWDECGERPPQKVGRFRKTLNREGDETFERVLRERGEWLHGDSRYLCEPSVYVVLSETDADGRCEFAVERTEHCEAILGFLSPIDAMMEGILRAKPGLRFQVRSSVEIERHYFLTRDQRLTLLLHLSWLAQDRRLVMLPGGEPGRLCRPVSRDASQGMPLRFEIDAASLDEVDWLYERAGLFAWEEMHRVYNLGDQQVAIAGVRTSRATLIPQGMGTGVELALFNPETLQWHFLPQEVLQES